MIRLLSLSTSAALVAAAAPAWAHPGAGAVHFLSEPDHVVGLIMAIVVPLAVWVLARRVRSRR